MNRWFGRKSGQKEPIFIVSGLPRSGTSMMMRMLSEGGLPVYTDQQRVADDDNPDGYYELEVVKEMQAGNLAWLSEAGGRVVKVISSLLEYLPASSSCKIIFMEREIREILASQRKMLERRGEVSQIDDTAMEEQFQRHLSVIKPWLARQPNLEVLYVSYNDIMSDAGPVCQRIMEFIDRPLDLDRMRSVPSRELYRNRKISVQE